MAAIFYFGDVFNQKHYYPQSWRVINDKLIVSSH